MDWIANTEIGLDPSNRVIKRLRCNQNEKKKKKKTLLLKEHIKGTHSIITKFSIQGLHDLPNGY